MNRALSSLQEGLLKITLSLKDSKHFFQLIFGFICLGILKREDLNAKELRELVDSLENLNMDKLAKGNKLTDFYDSLTLF